MFARRFIPLLVAATLISLGLAASTRPVAAEETTPDLRALLAGEGGLRLDGRPLDRAALLHLYQAHDFAPLWVTEPRREAALLQALGGAAEHGLDPAAFVVSATRPEQRELLLTDAFLRYATALARGRVRASEVEADWAFAAPAFDADAALDRAVAGEVGAVLADLAPAEPGYRRLQDALAGYRRIAAGGDWGQVPDTAKLKRDDGGAALPGAVRHRRRRRRRARHLRRAQRAGGGAGGADPRQSRALARAAAQLAEDAHRGQRARGDAHGDRGRRAAPRHARHRRRRGPPDPGDARAYERGAVQSGVDDPGLDRQERDPAQGQARPEISGAEPLRLSRRVAAAAARRRQRARPRQVRDAQHLRRLSARHAEPAAVPARQPQPEPWLRPAGEPARAGPLPAVGPVGLGRGGYRPRHRRRPDRAGATAAQPAGLSAVLDGLRRRRRRGRVPRRCLCP